MSRRLRNLPFVALLAGACGPTAETVEVRHPDGYLQYQGQLEDGVRTSDFERLPRGTIAPGSSVLFELCWRTLRSVLGFLVVTIGLGTSAVPFFISKGTRHVLPVLSICPSL